MSAVCVAQFLAQQPVHLHLALSAPHHSPNAASKDDSSCINVLRLQIAASDYRRRCGLFCRNRSANVVYNGRFSGRHGIKREKKLAMRESVWAVGNGSAEATLQGAVVNRKQRIWSFEAFRVSYFPSDCYDNMLVSPLCETLACDIDWKPRTWSAIHELHWPNYSEVRRCSHLWRSCRPKVTAFSEIYKPWIENRCRMLMIQILKFLKIYCFFSNEF